MRKSDKTCRGRTEGCICIAQLLYHGNVGQCVGPQHGAYRGLVVKADLVVRLYAYLQKIAVLVLDGESGTVVSGMVVPGVLMRHQQVQELPGRNMQRKHSQEYDSQYLM